MTLRDEILALTVVRIIEMRAAPHRLVSKGIRAGEASTGHLAAIVLDGLAEIPRLRTTALRINRSQPAVWRRFLVDVKWLLDLHSR